MEKVRKSLLIITRCQWKVGKNNNENRHFPELRLFFTVVLSTEMFVFILWKLKVFFYSKLCYFTPSRFALPPTLCVTIFFQVEKEKVEMKQKTHRHRQKQKEKSILMIYFTNFCSLNFLFFHPEQWRQIANFNLTPWKREFSLKVAN